MLLLSNIYVVVSTHCKQIITFSCFFIFFHIPSFFFTRCHCSTAAGSILAADGVAEGGAAGAGDVVAARARDHVHAGAGAGVVAGDGVAAAAAAAAIAAIAFAG